MSDDWQVVEALLSANTSQQRKAFLSLARLREREAQLERELEEWQLRYEEISEPLGEQIFVRERIEREHREAAEARVAELERVQSGTALESDERGARVNELSARVARLEKALREIAELKGGNGTYDVDWSEDGWQPVFKIVARRALAHEEEKVQPWNRPDWPERSGL